MPICDHLNALAEGDCRNAFHNCCASSAWVNSMLARRPFASDADVARAAADIWWSLGESDWLEALAAHPRIGDVDSLRAKYAATLDWAAAEQSGVQKAGEDVLRQLAELNRAYEARYGFLFVVCASGKSAREMLGILQSRMSNQRSDELRIAAGEQLEISLLRLTRLPDSR